MCVCTSEFRLGNNGLVNNYLDVAQMCIWIWKLYLYLLSSVRMSVSQFQEIKQEYLTIMLLITFSFNYIANWSQPTSLTSGCSRHTMEVTGRLIYQSVHASYLLDEWVLLKTSGGPLWGQQRAGFLGRMDIRTPSSFLFTRLNILVFLHETQVLRPFIECIVLQLVDSHFFPSVASRMEPNTASAEQNTPP